jgi:hypothetical protein
MSAAREKDQADFDLEAFIDLFDEALTSEDPSVRQTLQHLMVIAALARNHAKHDRHNGPLRRMYDNHHDILRRLDRLEVDRATFKPGFGPVPTVNPNVPLVWPAPTTGTQWPPQPGTYPPGTIWAQSSTSTTWPNSGASALTTSGTSAKIVERVDELLKDEKYKGSTVKAG